MSSSSTFIKAIAKSFNSILTKITLGLSLFAVSFSAEAQSISIGSPVDGVEGSSDMSFVVFIEGGGVNTTGSAITGSLSYAGTGTPLADFVVVSNFSIPNGANATTITLLVLDDNLIECTETVTAIISNPSVGTIGTASSTAYIIDDDCFQPLISIGSPVDGTEGSSSITYTVFIEGGGVNTTGSAITGTISYNGTGSNPADFTPVPNFSIQPGANSTTITIIIIDDVFVEPSETVIATLIGNPSVGSYANTTSTAIIFDNDAGSLVVSIGSPIDGEEGGADCKFVVFLENGMINGTGSNILGSINYSGTATNLSDYTAPLTFSIPNGESSDTLILNVIDDILLECNETVIATISSPSIGTVGTPTSTANIVDDECSQVSISIGSPVDGTEGSSDISYMVSLDGGLINSTGSSITGFVNLSGTATIGTDCSDVLSFDIPDGASFETLVVTVIDDTIIEPTESVIATISSPSIGVISASNVETAYIFDNDSTTSINEMDFSDVILSVYPNPTRGSFVIEADQQILRVEMSDLQGRTIQSWKTSAEKVNVNIDGSSEGYYIFTVFLNDGRFVTAKVLKE